MAMRPRANNPTGNRQRGAAARPVYEDFKPKSEWTQEQESDNLLIFLPGFTKESLKVSTEGTNTLRIRGERLVIGNKWQRFQEDFRVPDYCNIRGTRARFEGEILKITIPKKTITRPTPKEESKPTSSATTSQKTPEILPPKEPVAPKATALKQEDKAKPFQESHVPPKPISPVPPKVLKEPMTQKVQENIAQKITAQNKEDSKANGSQESHVPPKPMYSVPAEVLKEPMSQKVQEKILPKNADKAKDFQESHVPSNPISPVSESKKEKLPLKHEVGSGASTHQETMNATKAELGHGEMERVKRIHDLMEAEEAAKRRKIMEGENKDEKAEMVEKRIQETEKTAGIDQDEAKYRKRKATSSGTGHFEPRNFKKAVKSLAELDEERKLLVNMGAGVLVIMALGAYIYHTYKS